MSIKELIEDRCNRFAAISLRERAMIAVAVVVGIALLGFTLFVEPEQIKLKKVRGSVEQKRSEVKKLNTQWVAFQEQLKQNPDAQAGAELEALRLKLRQSSENLQKASNALVSPAEMNGVLESILAGQKGLRLLSLRTLPPAPFMETPSKETPSKPTEGVKTPEKAIEKAKGFDIYRHGVELKLTGNYSALTAYLQQLEAQKRRLLWDEVRLKVLEHPKAELTLTVYTLSVDEAWLSL